MKISVRKYDPTRDEAPYLAEYDVPKTEYMTLLEALVYIDEGHEALAHDYSCRGRICGRCAMMLDGEPCTACTKALTDEDHVVEPLKGFPVIRDLVVDKTEFHDKLSSLAARECAHNITWEEIEKPVDPAAAVMLDGIERCARCGVCMASCPVVQMAPDSYAGPAGMVAISLRHFDPYDDGDRIPQAVGAGLWNCTMCGMCDNVCPVAEIDHIGIWTVLRDAATSKGLTEKVGSALSFGK